MTTWFYTAAVTNLNNIIQIKKGSLMKTLLLLLTMFASTSAMAIDYHCSGTEPFWGLGTNGNQLTYEYFGEEEIKRTEKITSKKLMAARPESFGAVLKTKNVTATIISNDQCSDGMSDTVYSHSIVLDIRNLPMALEGCCMEAPKK